MENLPKTKEQIERMIISEMQTFAECENALEVVVIPIVDRSHTATWSHVLIPASRTERLVIVHCSSLSRVFSEPMTSFECIKPTKETFERLTAPLASREGCARGGGRRRTPDPQRRDGVIALHCSSSPEPHRPPGRERVRLMPHLGSSVARINAANAMSAFSAQC